MDKALVLEPYEQELEVSSWWKSTTVTNSNWSFTYPLFPLADFPGFHEVLMFLHICHGTWSISIGDFLSSLFLLSLGQTVIDAFSFYVVRLLFSSSHSFLPSPSLCNAPGHIFVLFVLHCHNFFFNACTSLLITVLRFQRCRSSVVGWCGSFDLQFASWLGCSRNSLEGI